MDAIASSSPPKPAAPAEALEAKAGQLAAAQDLAQRAAALLKAARARTDPAARLSLETAALALVEQLQGKLRNLL